MTYNKYKNKPVVIDGIRFQSTFEGEYYCTLKLLKQHGRVIKFERQVRYKIIVDGVYICSYLLDFKVYYNDETIEHIDVKGVATDVYKIKKKLVEVTHGIKILEVYARPKKAKIRVSNKKSY